MTETERAIEFVLSHVDVRHAHCGGVAEFVPPIDGQLAFVRCQRCGHRLLADELALEAYE